MHPRRIVFVAGVAAARAVVALVLALAFWAAAPIVLGWSPTTVMTASMSPAVEVGDIVVATPLERAQMVPGRVLLAHDPDWPGRLRLHRVVEVSADGSLVTKGDANPSADTSRIDPGAVIGAGVLRVPWVGLPVVWIRSGEVVPLAAAAAAFVLCLSVAMRRGEDDDERADASGGSAAEEKSPPPTEVPTTRRARRAAGILASVALGVGLAATPAWAALADATGSDGFVTAGYVSAPWSLGCDNDGGAVVTWTYDGWEPRSFDLLVDGQVVSAGIPSWARSARVPADRYYSLFSTSRVTVRTNVGARWWADSSQSITVGGTFFGFGRPFCR